MGALNNARWVAMAQIVKISAQVVGMVVLARLVEPAEYGIMAMATVVTNFAMIFRDMGSSAALIQKENLDHAIKNAAFWFNIAMGVSIALLIVLASPVIARVFGSPRLIIVLMLLACAFPISSSAAVHQGLLERDSAFRTVAVIEILAVSIGLGVAVILGWWGAGVYSLVAQTLIVMTLTSTLFWRASKWRPSGPSSFSWTELRPIIGFSSNIVGFNMVNYFSRNADSMIIGHFFSAGILGAYSLAYRVMLFPLQSLTFVAARSLYPILSRQQNALDKMKQTYLQVIRVVATLVAPMMAGMFVLRESFISIFLGNGWDLSARLLAWLAPTGFIQAILSTTGVVFMATGATRTLMYLGVLGALLQVGAFFLGLSQGVESMVRWYLLANIINFFPVMYLCSREMKAHLFEVIRAILPSLLSGAGMAIVLYEIVKNFYFSSSLYVNFLSYVLFGGGGYLVFYFCLDRKRFLEVYSFVFRRGVKTSL